MFEMIETPSIPAVKGARIKVIGVGGAGGNAIATMIRDWGVAYAELSKPQASLFPMAEAKGIDFIVANTDIQALKGHPANVKVQLGEGLTRGLGAGADPEVGRKAAIESEPELTKLLEGADMIFITAGMGGGTGTGAAPVIAKIAKDLGALTIGVVTKPFHFEGKRRSRFAEQGIEQLAEAVDSLITIPNERLLVVAGKNMPMVEAFRMADQVLLHAVRGISDLILEEGLINLDFADIRAVMKETGMTLMGSGVATGEHRAIEAATRAISSPLLENVSIHGATGILMNVTGGSDLTLFEVNEAAKLIQEESHEDANIIFGSVIDPNMKDEVRVTVIATGFHKGQKKATTYTAYQKTTASMSSYAASVQATVVSNSGSVSSLFAQSTQTASSSENTISENTKAGSISFVHKEDFILAEKNQENFETTSSGSGRQRIPVQTDLKRLMGDLKNQGYMQEFSGPDQDEYDIPTFLRKHAD